MNQEQILQNLDPIERLSQAFHLSDFTLEITKLNILRNYKKVHKKTINKELSVRLK